VIFIILVTCIIKCPELDLKDDSEVAGIIPKFKDIFEDLLGLPFTIDQSSTLREMIRYWKHGFLMFTGINAVT